MQTKPIADPVELDQAHRRMMLDQTLDQGLEITQKLMNLLVRKEGIKSITYGKPGIRLYVEGEKQNVISSENMHIDDHYEQEIRKISDEARTRRMAGK